MTISVTNNQMPLMPLFSPVYTSTRPYSQTRSNTQRDLMLPDEILRLDRRQCIALFQGHKPALLYKLAPEELPGYNTLKSCRVIDYTPEWQKREKKQEKPAAPPQPEPTPKPAQEQPSPQAKKKINPAQDLEYQIEAGAGDNSGLGMRELTEVRGDDDPDEEDNPPR